MSTKLANLIAHAPVLTDGAWGTQIQALGLPIGDCPDAWNLHEPKKVESVARSYVEAGSQVILTNTFGASRVALERHGLADQAAAINEAGARISKRAAASEALVFGSIGPCTKMLMMDEVTADELESAFTEQAVALAKGGADALLVETMSDLDEALIALAAAQSTGLPVIVSMTFSSGKQHDRTLMGITPEQAAVALVEHGADAVGANCGLGIDAYIWICARLAAVAEVPIWIKPNAGLPELVDGVAVYDTPEMEFAGLVPALIQAGATFIGGCCGTTPDFVRAMVPVITHYQQYGVPELDDEEDEA